MHRQVFQPPRGEKLGPCWEPPVDVLETEHEVLVFVALPGVDPGRGRGADRGRAARRTRPAGPAARAAAGGDPPAGAAAGPLRAARSRCPPGRYAVRHAAGLWLPRLHAREAEPGGDAMNLLQNAGPERGPRRAEPEGEGAAVPLPEDALILLPVRDTVLFPGMIIPVAVGRPKIGRGDPAGRARGAPDRRRDAARSGGGRARRGRPPPHRHRRQHPALHDRAGRHPSHRLPGRAALPHPRPARRGRRSRSRGSSASPRRRAGCPRSRAASSTSRRWRSRRSACCRRRRRACVESVRAITSPGALADLAAAYIDIKPEEKQEILETIDLTRAHGQGLAAARPAHRGAADLARDRPADQGRLRRAPARGGAARADGRDPAPARRGRRQGRGGGRALGGDRRGRHARGGRGAGPQGAAPLRAHARGRRRGRHGAHLSRLADRAALEAARGEADRHRRGAGDPRRGPLRAREDQDPHRRVPGDPQARARGQGADPLLRRPARRRQDLARPVDRPGDGPAVRAGEPRRRARRGRDPRPPPHLYRRAARQHHPGDPQGRRAQLRDDARRDRQAGPRHPGRPVLGDARGARPRAEPHLPRQLPRRAVRPQPRRLHRDGQHARHHPRAACATGWR